MKPLNRKNYGSIPHLPNSRMGPADRHCPKQQAAIATRKARDHHDEIIVQEKLDGSNVGVAKKDDQILALNRAGYLAATSPYKQHHYFSEWVARNKARFQELLREGERIAGEWLMQAHGTRYRLTHEPFVAFDLLTGHKRLPYDEFMRRVQPFELATPHLVHRGGPITIENVMQLLGDFGFHGSTDQIEGAVWRVERDRPTGVRGQKRRVVDFLAKYVRPDKADGVYLPDISGKDPVWNWQPNWD